MHMISPSDEHNTFEITCLECNSTDCELKVISKWNYTIIRNNCGNEQ